MNEKAEDSMPRSQRRVLGWLISSFLIHILSLGGFAGGICGCHFHPIALVFGVPPLVWAIYVSALEKTKCERTLAMLNLFAVGLWIFIE